MFTLKDLLMNTCCNNIYPSEDMNRWESCPSTMLANADNYYTKSEVDEKLEDISISGGGITSGEVQSMIDASVEPIEGSVEALSGAVEQLSTDMENKADRSEIPSLENYYNKTEVNNLLDTKLDTSAYTPVDMSGYWTSAQTKNYVDNAISGIPSNILAVDWEDLMENMNDDKWDELVDAFQNNNPIYAIVDYSGEGFIDIDQKPIDGYVFIDGNTGEQGSRIELKRLTSDGYDWITITKNGSNNYTVTNGNVQYQQRLEAGTGIVINGNVISATGGGTGITVDQNLDSGSTNPVVNSAITQAIDAKADKTGCLGDARIDTAPWGYSRLLTTKADGSGEQARGYFSKINGYYIATNYSFDTMDFQLVEKSAVTSAITSASTNDEVAGAKAVYDAIQAAGGGTGITVDQSLDSGSTNPVTNSAITNALDAKADASNVYTITETNYLLNNLSQSISNKANVWCGDEASFNALTNKDANTIYLVY